ncbi:MAG: helix-turn-helix transcriptional regulator [Deltaproteobacteria bacterium]|nr:helix-turn-helix transcriptional regulator [Deltaproteobacteria bacterium]
MDRLDRLQELVGLVYEGALDPAAWPLFLSTFADAVGGAVPTLALRYPRDEDLGLYFTHDVDPSFNDSYSRYFYHHDVYRQHGGNALPAGSYGTQASLVGLDASTVARSEFFNDWIRPQGCVAAPTLCSILARDEVGPTAALTAMRPRGAREYGDDEIALLGALTPHLRRAVLMQEQLGLAAAERAALATALDRAPGAIVLLDRRGGVLRANRQAEALLSSEDGCAVRDGQLVGARAADTSALHAAIAAALRSREHSGVTNDIAAVHLERPSQRRALLAQVAALGGPARTEWHPDAAAAVFLTDPEAGAAASDQVLRARFGLTPAQARLATLLAAGASLDEAGTTLGVTIHTVRAHLKQVFAKTGTRRQAALVRLVLTGSSSGLDR